MPPAAPAPARTRTARTRAVGVLASLVLVFALSACTGRPHAPTKYGKTTKKNFLAGCETPGSNDPTANIGTVPASTSSTADFWLSPVTPSRRASTSSWERKESLMHPPLLTG